MEHGTWRRLKVKTVDRGESDLFFNNKGMSPSDKWLRRYTAKFAQQLQATAPTRRVAAIKLEGMVKVGQREVARLKINVSTQSLEIFL